MSAPGGESKRLGMGVARVRRLLSLEEQAKSLPNILTAARLLLCLVFFAVMIYASVVLHLPVDAEGELHWQRLRGDIFHVHSTLRTESSFLTILLDGAFVVFVLAALSDIADGYIARKYGMETDLGRIFDPFVDKLMILGSFTLLMPLTVHVGGWMVVLILWRELLVSQIRGFAEARGIAFPASFWGKAKMLSQSLAIGSSLLYVGHPGSPFLKWTFIVLLWASLASTVLSGVIYLARARKLLFVGAPPAKAPAGSGGVAVEPSAPADAPS